MFFTARFQPTLISNELLFPFTILAKFYYLKSFGTLACFMSICHLPLYIILKRVFSDWLFSCPSVFWFWFVPEIGWSLPCYANPCRRLNRPGVLYSNPRAIWQSQMISCLLCTESRTSIIVLTQIYTFLEHSQSQNPHKLGEPNQQKEETNSSKKPCIYTICLHDICSSVERTKVWTEKLPLSLFQKLLGIFSKLSQLVGANWQE